MRTLLFGLSTLLFFGFSSWADVCDSSQNLVTNCGFETGTLSSWQLSGAQSSSAFLGVTYGVDQADAFSGNYGVYLGGYGVAVSLGQSFTTTPGTTYLISYELAQAPAVPAPYANSFTTAFNGTTLYSSTNPQSFPFTLFQFTVTATNSTSALLFSAQDDTGFYSLDDVSVQAASASATPEPATSALIGVSFCLAVAILRWRVATAGSRSA